jgi:ketosteroid isomerase-like protein
MPAQSPEQCEELFAQYVNAGNVDDLLALYETHASHLRPDGGVAQRSDGIRLVLDEFVAMQPALGVSLQKVVLTGDDLAVLYDTWTLAAKDPGGNAIQMNGKGVHIVRRQPDGAWKFVFTGGHERRLTTRTSRRNAPPPCAAVP